MIKSPLRYPGGKSKALSKIIPYLSNFDDYREPFIGGGSVMIERIQSCPGKEFSANDLNYELFCFWKVLQASGGKLIKEIQSIRDSYDDGKKLYHELLARRESDLSELERARDFFILNRITFSGLADAGGYSNESFHKRFTQSSIDRLNNVSKLVKNVSFTNDDYSELCNKSGKNVLIFLDPPYYSVTKSKLYGKDGILHLNFDHQKLFECLLNIDHKWVMTYDNCDYIRSLYDGFNIIPWEHQYGMNNYQSPQISDKKVIPKGKELFITNLDII